MKCTTEAYKVIHGVSSLFYQIRWCSLSLYLAKILTLKLDMDEIVTIYVVLKYIWRDSKFCSAWELEEGCELLQFGYDCPLTFGFLKKSPWSKRIFGFRRLISFCCQIRSGPMILIANLDLKSHFKPSCAILPLNRDIVVMTIIFNGGFPLKQLRTPNLKNLAWPLTKWHK